ncbi:hypothetical protein cand_035690 [Cryptosporidium andersoni]|uniref:Uncharacterized protein n=1 Tax=Cryptosporidium andersoni TaxID=117008 RepID=A0A1J4MVH8_9CRYT|nr:hypothetical protein cand_035690 [Cryptosporidium andersoni]
MLFGQNQPLQSSGNAPSSGWNLFGSNVNSTNSNLTNQNNSLFSTTGQVQPSSSNNNTIWGSGSSSYGTNTNQPNLFGNTGTSSNTSGLGNMAILGNSGVSTTNFGGLGLTGSLTGNLGGIGNSGTLSNTNMMGGMGGIGGMGTVGLRTNSGNSGILGNLNNATRTDGLVGLTGNSTNNTNSSLFGTSLTSQTNCPPGGAHYLPLNPTVGQLTNYIQSWKVDFENIEKQLRENDKHIEYLTNGKLVEITRLCTTYKQGVERRSDEIENIKARQDRIVDSIEDIIPNISTVQQLSYDLIQIYDRIKDIDSQQASQQIQPLRLPLPIFEFFCQNMSKKCQYIEETIRRLENTVSSLRNEINNMNGSETKRNIIQIINNHFEIFTNLLAQCSALHDKSESFVSISKLHETSRS